MIDPASGVVPGMFPGDPDFPHGGDVTPRTDPEEALAVIDGLLRALHWDGVGIPQDVLDGISSWRPFILAGSDRAAGFVGFVLENLRQIHEGHHDEPLVVVLGVARLRGLLRTARFPIERGPEVP